jgi:hypothetical protein
MASGDEPGFGGQDYRAENLHALIEGMDSQQRQRFRSSVIDHTIWYVERALASDETLAQNLIVAVRAATNGDTSQLDSFLSSIDSLEYFVREMISRLIDAARTPDEETTAVLARQTAMWAQELLSPRQGSWPGASSDGTKEEWIVRRWQVEAAWAILRGGNPPANDGVLNDPLQHAYASSNLKRLIAHMSPSQWQAFRHSLISQAARIADTVLPSEQRDFGARRCLELVNQHLDMPDKTVLAECAAITEKYMKRLTTLAHGEPSPIEIHAAFHCANALMQGDERFTDSVLFALYSAAKQMPYGDQWLKDHPIREWQIEAAWSILNDTPIPPLELTP